MKLFLDSADPQEIRCFARWGVLDGVTTTPTFFRRLGVRDVRHQVQAIAAHCAGEIHLEALGQHADEIVSAARANRDLGANVVSKIPISPAALEATSRLAEEGIRVNLHLVFTVNQALLGAKAGAAYVCPLLGRMVDAGLNAGEVVAEMVDVLSVHAELSTTVMVSSIRGPDAARQAFGCGAKAVTIPGAVLRQLLESPLTDRASRILVQDNAQTCAAAQSMRGLDSLPQLSPTARLRNVLSEMTNKGIGIAAVVTEGRVVGVLTDGDVRRALAAGATVLDTPVEAVMTRSFQSVGPDDLLGPALAMMRAQRIAEVLVCNPESRAPLGVLSIHDVLPLPGPGER